MAGLSGIITAALLITTCYLSAAAADTTCQVSTYASSIPIVTHTAPSEVNETLHSTMSQWLLDDETDWIKVGTSLFQVSDTKMDAFDSYVHCKQRGGVMATYRSELERFSLRIRTDANKVWLGYVASGRGIEDVVNPHWVSVDGTPIGIAGLSPHWFGNDADNEGHECLHDFLDKASSEDTERKNCDKQGWNRALCRRERQLKIDVPLNAELKPIPILKYTSNDIWDEVVPGWWYRLTKTADTRSTLNDDCESEFPSSGSWLADIRTEEENNLVADWLVKKWTPFANLKLSSRINYPVAWIGVRMVKKFGNWKWRFHQDDAEAGTSLFRGSVATATGQKLCVTLQGGERAWAALPCDHYMLSICKKPAPTVTAPPGLPVATVSHTCSGQWLQWQGNEYNYVPQSFIGIQNGWTSTDICKYFFAIPFDTTGVYWTAALEELKKATVDSTSSTGVFCKRLTRFPLNAKFRLQEDGSNSGTLTQTLSDYSKILDEKNVLYNVRIVQDSLMPAPGLTVFMQAEVQLLPPLRILANPASESMTTVFTGSHACAGIAGIKYKWTINNDNPTTITTTNTLQRTFEECDTYDIELKVTWKVGMDTQSLTTTTTYYACEQTTAVTTSTTTTTTTTTVMPSTEITTLPDYEITTTEGTTLPTTDYSTEYTTEERTQSTPSSLQEASSTMEMSATTTIRSIQFEHESTLNPDAVIPTTVSNVQNPDSTTSSGTTLIGTTETAHEYDSMSPSSDKTDEVIIQSTGSLESTEITTSPDYEITTTEGTMLPTTDYSTEYTTEEHTQSSETPSSLQEASSTMEMTATTTIRSIQFEYESTLNPDAVIPTTVSNVQNPDSTTSSGTTLIATETAQEYDPTMSPSSGKTDEFDTQSTASLQVQGSTETAQEYDSTSPSSDKTDEVGIQSTGSLKSTEITTSPDYEITTTEGTMLPTTDYSTEYTTEEHMQSSETPSPVQKATRSSTMEMSATTTIRSIQFEHESTSNPDAVIPTAVSNVQNPDSTTTSGTTLIGTTETAQEYNPTMSPSSGKTDEVVIRTGSLESTETTTSIDYEITTTEGTMLATTGNSTEYTTEERTQSSETLSPVQEAGSSTMEMSATTTIRSIQFEHEWTSNPDAVIPTTVTNVQNPDSTPSSGTTLIGTTETAQEYDPTASLSSGKTDEVVTQSTGSLQVQGSTTVKETAAEKIVGSTGTRQPHTTAKYGLTQQPGATELAPLNTMGSIAVTEPTTSTTTTAGNMPGTTGTEPEYDSTGTRQPHTATELPDTTATYDSIKHSVTTELRMPSFSSSMPVKELTTSSDEREVSMVGTTGIALEYDSTAAGGTTELIMRRTASSVQVQPSATNTETTAGNLLGNTLKYESTVQPYTMTAKDDSTSYPTAIEVTMQNTASSMEPQESTSKTDIPLGGMLSTTRTGLGYYATSLQSDTAAQRDPTENLVTKAIPSSATSMLAQESRTTGDAIEAVTVTSVEYNSTAARLTTEVATEPASASGSMLIISDSMLVATSTAALENDDDSTKHAVTTEESMPMPSMASSMQIQESTTRTGPNVPGSSSDSTAQPDTTAFTDLTDDRVTPEVTIPSRAISVLAQKTATTTTKASLTGDTGTTDLHVHSATTGATIPSTTSSTQVQETPTSTAATDVSMLVTASIALGIVSTSNRIATSEDVTLANAALEFDSTMYNTDTDRGTSTTGSIITKDSTTSTELPDRSLSDTSSTEMEYESMASQITTNEIDVPIMVTSEQPQQLAPSTEPTTDSIATTTTNELDYRSTAQPASTAVSKTSTTNVSTRKMEEHEPATSPNTTEASLPATTVRSTQIQQSATSTDTMEGNKPFSTSAILASTALDYDSLAHTVNTGSHLKHTGVTIKESTTGSITTGKALPSIARSTQGYQYSTERAVIHTTSTPATYEATTFKFTMMENFQSPSTSMQTLEPSTGTDTTAHSMPVATRTTSDDSVTYSVTSKRHHEDESTLGTFMSARSSASMDNDNTVTHTRSVVTDEAVPTTMSSMPTRKEYTASRDNQPYISQSETTQNISPQYEAEASVTIDSILIKTTEAAEANSHLTETWQTAQPGDLSAKPTVGSTTEHTPPMEFGTTTDKPFVVSSTTIATTQLLASSFLPRQESTQSFAKHTSNAILSSAHQDNVAMTEMTGNSEDTTDQQTSSQIPTRDTSRTTWPESTTKLVSTAEPEYVPRDTDAVTQAVTYTSASDVETMAAQQEKKTDAELPHSTAHSSEATTTISTTSTGGETMSYAAEILIQIKKTVLRCLPLCDAVTNENTTLLSMEQTRNIIISCETCRTENELFVDVISRTMGSERTITDDVVVLTSSTIGIIHMVDMVNINPRITQFQITAVVDGQPQQIRNFKINWPPDGGQCFAEPTTNVMAMMTNVDLSCLNWHDTDGIKLYEFYRTSNDGERLPIGYSNTGQISVKLPLGMSEITVDITDNLGTTTQLVPVATIHAYLSPNGSLDYSDYLLDDTTDAWNVSSTVTMFIDNLISLTSMEPVILELSNPSDVAWSSQLTMEELYTSVGIFGAGAIQNVPQVSNSMAEFANSSGDLNELLNMIQGSLRYNPNLLLETINSNGNDIGMNDNGLNITQEEYFASVNNMLELGNNAMSEVVTNWLTSIQNAPNNETNNMIPILSAANAILAFAYSVTLGPNSNISNDHEPLQGKFPITIGKIHGAETELLVVSGTLTIFGDDAIIDGDIRPAILPRGTAQDLHLSCIISNDTLPLADKENIVQLDTDEAMIFSPAHQLYIHLNNRSMISWDNHTISLHNPENVQLGFENIGESIAGLHYTIWNATLVSKADRISIHGGIISCWTEISSMTITISDETTISNMADSGKVKFMNLAIKLVNDYGVLQLEHGQLSMRHISKSKNHSVTQIFEAKGTRERSGLFTDHQFWPITLEGINISALYSSEYSSDDTIQLHTDHSRIVLAPPGTKNAWSSYESYLTVVDADFYPIDVAIPDSDLEEALITGKQIVIDDSTIPTEDGQVYTLPAGTIMFLDGLRLRFNPLDHHSENMLPIRTIRKVSVHLMTRGSGDFKQTSVNVQSGRLYVKDEDHIESMLHLQDGSRVRIVHGKLFRDGESSYRINSGHLAVESDFRPSSQLITGLKAQSLVSIDAQILLQNILESTTKNLQDNLPTMRQPEIEQVSKGLFQMTTSLARTTETALSNPLASDRDIALAWEQENFDDVFGPLPVDRYKIRYVETYTEEEWAREAVRIKQQEIFKQMSSKIEETIDVLQDILLQKAISSGNDIAHEYILVHGGMVSVSVGPSSQMLALHPKCSDWLIKFPPTLADLGIDSLSEETRIVKKLVCFSNNPYAFAENAPVLVNSGAMVANLFQLNGTEIKVTRARHPIEIRGLVNRDRPAPSLYVGVPQLEPTEVLSMHTVSIHQYNGSIQIELEKINSVRAILAVYISFNKIPGPLKGQHEFSSLIGEDKRKFFWHIDSNKLENRTGIFYIGIGQISSSHDQENAITYSANTPTFTRAFTVSYALRVLNKGCFYFDHETLMYGASGVSPHTMSGDKWVSCHAHHLTPFSVGLFIPPNEIDFDFIFTNPSFEENVILIVTLLVSLISYVFALTYFYYRDNADENKKIHNLLDNYDGDPYHYILKLDTGYRMHASTDSIVSFIIYGTFGNSGIRDLMVKRNSDGEPRILQWGNTDRFLMSTNHCLGDITHVRMWHDRLGMGNFESWYMSRLTIQDLQDKQKFYFLDGRWFAADRGDGQVERILTVSSEQEADEMHNILHSHELVDRYNYFSMITGGNGVAGQRFTRCNRLSVVLLMFLSLMAISAIYLDFTAGIEAYTFVSIGNVKVTGNEVLVSMLACLLTTPLTALFSFVFRNCHTFRERKEAKRIAQSNGMHGVTNTSKMKKTRWHPFHPFVRAITWLLLITTILLCIAVVVLYSAQFHNDQARRWLAAFFCSALFSIFILEPILSVLMVVVASFYNRKDPLAEEYEIQYLCPMKENAELSQYDNGDDELAFAVSPDVLLKDADSRLRDEKLYDVLRELATYFAFLAVMLTLAYGSRTPMAYYYKDQMNQTLNLAQFHKIRKPHQFWDWSRDVLATKLHASWYNGDPAYHMRGYMDDKVSRILGFGVIRQIRGRRTSYCDQASSQMESLFDSCTTFTRKEHEDQTEQYGPGWIALQHYSGTWLPAEYRYQPAEDLHGLPYIGLLDTYSGGGYVSMLNGTTSKLQSRFTELQNESWINEGTRAIFVEFSVYNAQVNLFCIIQLVLEVPPLGALQPKISIEPLLLLKYHSDWALYILLAEIMFCCFALVNFLRIARNIHKMGCGHYFCQFWSWIDVSIVISSFVAIVSYVFRMIMIEQVLQLFEKTNGNVYIKLDYPRATELIFLWLLSLILFLTTMKMMRILRFNRRIGMLGSTLKNSSRSLYAFSFLFVVISMAFNSALYFTLFEKLEKYSNFITLTETSLSAMLGKFAFHDIISASFLAPVLFMLYMITATVLLLNFFIMILIASFEEVHSDAQKQLNDYEIFDHLKMKLFVWFGIRSANRKRHQEDYRKDKVPMDVLVYKTERFLGRLNRKFLRVPASATEARQANKKPRKVVIG